MYLKRRFAMVQVISTYFEAVCLSRVKMTFSMNLIHSACCTSGSGQLTNTHNHESHLSIIIMPQMPRGFCSYFSHFCLMISWPQLRELISESMEIIFKLFNATFHWLSKTQQIQLKEQTSFWQLLLTSHIRSTKLWCFALTCTKNVFSNTMTTLTTFIWITEWRQSPYLLPNGKI